MKVVLLDGEHLALDHLERQLKRVDRVERMEKFTDPRAARDYILSRDVDLVFLGIDMPQMTGLKLAEELLGIKPQLSVVFMAASDEHAVEAFELKALDYLIKPIKAERLTKTMRRVEARNALAGEREISSAKEILPVSGKPLHLNVFGHFSVELPDSERVDIRWRTAKAQELFLYLLQHRRQSVRKSVLIELLWPEFDDRKAYSQLYNTIYFIRKSLKPFGHRIQISSSLEGYVLNLNDASLDVEEWERAVQSGLPINADTIAGYGEAMKMYTGDYLQECDYWWLESERHRLKLLWMQMSFRMAEWYVSCGLEDDAVAVYRDICHHYPQAEDAHFALMKIYASRNERLSVTRQYRLIQTVLREELNERPSPYIEEWYVNWTKSQRD